MRGEQRRHTDTLAALRGSPPLARGTVWRGQQRRRNDGITPACAGNRTACRSWLRLCWDHPRLRGEQKWKQRKGPPREGSPPLARGTAPVVQDICDIAGITPACAGNSYFFSTPFKRRRDHPRLRGEQWRLLLTSAASKGSPPLARGTGPRNSFW